MFGKNKTAASMPEIKVAVAPQPMEKEAVREEKQNNTVIACDVRFEGNIITSGQVYIYGEVYGNIDSNGGIIKVMRSGRVEGNITSRELIVDGVVNGQCKSDLIDIYENGKINGAIAWGALAIKKGGAFIGQSETLQPVEQKSNVVGFAVEPPVEESPVAADVPAGENDSVAKEKKHR